MNCHDVLNGLGCIYLTLRYLGFVYLLACVYVCGTVELSLIMGP
jgi:hypothetical protein